MIRRDERSRLAPRPKSEGGRPARPFHAPSLTYRALAVPPGAFAASRAPRTKRAPPRELVREQLRVAVWEAEGGSLRPFPLSRVRR